MEVEHKKKSKKVLTVKDVKKGQVFTYADKNCEYYPFYLRTNPIHGYNAVDIRVGESYMLDPYMEVEIIPGKFVIGE